MITQAARCVLVPSQPFGAHREYDADEGLPVGAGSGLGPRGSLGLGHCSDTDDTDGGNVSDPEHYDDHRTGFSLHNFGAAMVSRHLVTFVPFDPTELGGNIIDAGPNCEDEAPYSESVRCDPIRGRCSALSLWALVRTGRV